MVSGFRFQVPSGKPKLESFKLERRVNAAWSGVEHGVAAVRESFLPWVEMTTRTL